MHPNAGDLEELYKDFTAILSSRCRSSARRGWPLSG
jgi:hypothetical protein